MKAERKGGRCEIPRATADELVSRVAIVSHKPKRIYPWQDQSTRVHATGEKGADHHARRSLGRKSGRGRGELSVVNSVVESPGTFSL